MATSEQERGRRLSSQQGRHISPQPSPHDNYHDAVTGLDPSMSQNTFVNGRYSTSRPQDVTLSAAYSPNNSGQQFSNAYSISQNNVMSNQYLNQFGQDFILQANNSYGGNVGQDFGMGQYPNINQDNINPAELSKISSPDHPSPSLLSPDHQSPGPQSPTSTTGQYQTPQHSRHTSLDPNSAYVGNEWQGSSFRQYQQSPSDVSDVSSVHHSPYLQHTDLNESHSPLFQAQANDTLGMESFTLTDRAHSQPGSAYVSPRLMPQQEGLGIGNDMMLNQSFVPGEMYPQDQSFQNVGAMHNRNRSVVSQMGQADQTQPPSIHIEPAPVSRQQSFGPQGEMMQNALSPPTSSSRGRNRSQSDVTFTRPINSRSVSPGASRNSDNLSVQRSPSPSGSASRSSSPGVSEGRISKDRRASTSAINNNNREYILDLADPNRPNNTTGGNGTRVQKHPATFQCTLCPKRFTRAYNLRSHLRTHTDERPFVCTVCGKAFARQHDRKRHEGLHSGEKKFVCKGELSHSPGQTWGCGRRFARADALGRHFRSEAGRVCIKPLLDEEALERAQKAMMEQQHQQTQMQHNMLQPVPPTMMVPAMDANAGFALPAALLAQYPALQNIDWSALQGGNDDPGELSDVGYGGSGYEDDGYGGGHLSDSGLNVMGHAQWS